MSFWPPPPQQSSSSPNSSPPHHSGSTSPHDQHQQHPHHFDESAHHPDSQAYPMFSHEPAQQQQQQQHDAFVWHQQHHQHHHHQHHQHLPVMTIDPLPILHSSSAEHQRASVSLEDEIFEARMLQEALRDCDTTAPGSENLRQHHLHHQHHGQQQQHSSSPLFQPQSFQAQLMFPSQFTNVTTPNNALLRGSLSQQVVSPVENMRNYMMQHPHVLGTSPSSYSSSSSNRSPVMGLASLQGSTPPSSASSGTKSANASGQAQPKKRVQTARICHVEGCTRGIRSRGLCKAHGGGRRCTTPGCTTSDQGGGHCVLHGGGRRCRVDGCMKSAQWRGVCKLHGGARRCRYGHCTKNGQVKQGYCRLHYNLLTQQRLQGLLLTGQQEGQSQAGGERKEEREQDEEEKRPFTMEGYQQQQRP